MSPKSAELKRLRLRQLADRLSHWEKVRDLPLPKNGWISALRQALGMGVNQLAERMGVDPTAVIHFEKREAAGKITVDSLRRAAEAMDSKLVYAIVPNKSLDSTLEAQARKVARARLGRIEHSMSLEAQEVQSEEALHQESDLANRLLSEWHRALWDDPDAPKKPRGT